MAASEYNISEDLDSSPVGKLFDMINNQLYVDLDFVPFLEIDHGKLKEVAAEDEDYKP